jgi:succinate dehydrogenase / fumarate reductase membrane anchor subunit
VVKRHVVGAHYGLKDWVAQRITAVLMAVYTLLWLVIALVNRGIDEALWRTLFANEAFRVATLLFGLSLAWHAWIGMRDIWMDYIKPTALRFSLEIITVVVLVGYAVWLVEILWAPR